MSRKDSKTSSSSHMFSIELISRDSVKCLVIPTENNAKILIEGFLGDIEALGIIEGVMLEINGSNGTLKMDLSEKEILKLLHSYPRARGE
jgi:hypothetical protein